MIRSFGFLVLMLLSSLCSTIYAQPLADSSTTNISIGWKPRLWKLHGVGLGFKTKVERDFNGFAFNLNHFYNRYGGNGVAISGVSSRLGRPFNGLAFSTFYLGTYQVNGVALSAGVHYNSGKVSRGLSAAPLVSINNDGLNGVAVGGWTVAMEGLRGVGIGGLTYWDEIRGLGIGLAHIDDAFNIRIDTSNESKGVQISGLFTTTVNNSDAYDAYYGVIHRGVKLSGGILWGQYQLYGVSAGLIGTKAYSSKGLSVGGLLNFTTKSTGANIGGLVAISRNSTGLSWGTLYNRTKELHKGVAVGAVNIHKYTIGAQIGLYNRAHRWYASYKIAGDPIRYRSPPKSVQIGVVNSNARIQIGLINLRQSAPGVQIGLLNYVADNHWLFRWLPIVNFSGNPNKGREETILEKQPQLPSTYKATGYIDTGDPSKVGLRGKVVDERGEPIFYAAIYILNTSNGAITDVNGEFRCLIPSPQQSRYTIQISYAGYEPLEIKDFEMPPGRIQILDIKLQPTKW